MSRAFVSEDDGWRFCIVQHDSCMFAKEDGSCMLKACRRPVEEQRKAPEHPPETQSEKA